MFGKGGKLSLAAIDADIGKVLDEGLKIAEEFAGELPLVGISVQAMHDAEERGLKLCAERLAEIKTEMARLSAEAADTETILKAGSLKLTSLKQYLGMNAPNEKAPDKAEVPAAIHTDIQTDRPNAEPVITDIQA